MAQPAPFLLVEHADAGTRSDGLVARRTALYPDGRVWIVTGPGAFARGQLEPVQLAEIVRRAERAYLDELPEVIASRAHWFDSGEAWCALRWRGSDGADVRIEGDLRRGSPDRALAPHGFVQTLQAIEAIAPTVFGSEELAERIEFELRPWNPRDPSPFAEETEPLDLPDGVEEPRERTFSAEGAAARELAAAAAAGRPLRLPEGLWRLFARPIFPHEGTPRAADTGRPAPSRG